MTGTGESESEGLGIGGQENQNPKNPPRPNVHYHTPWRLQKTVPGEKKIHRETETISVQNIVNT